MADQWTGLSPYLDTTQPQAPQVPQMPMVSREQKIAEVYKKAAEMAITGGNTELGNGLLRMADHVYKAGTARPFDANNEYDAFLALAQPQHGQDITTQEGYNQAVKWWGTPAGQEAWTKLKQGFKRPGTFQIGMMNGRTYAIQGNPNNEQLEYYAPEQKAWVPVPQQMTFMQGLVNPQEAALLGIPAYTPKGAAQGQNLSAVPQAQRADLAAFDQSMNIVDDIEKYSKNVNTFSPGVIGTGRLAGGVTNVFGAVTQTNKDAAMLETKRGELSNIIRAMGEKGTLAEGDVNRGLALIPSNFDTEQVAKQKIKDLRDLFANNKKAKMGLLTQPIQQNAQPVENDPLGIRRK